MTPSLPAEYQQYLAAHGAFEGVTSGEPGYIALWALAELAGNNSDIQIEKYAPGYQRSPVMAEAKVLTFDASGTVYMLPLIGMEPRYAVKVANSFVELASRFELAA